jgi:hypothetical protein
MLAELIVYAVPQGELAVQLDTAYISAWLMVSQPIRTQS